MSGEESGASSRKKIFVLFWPRNREPSQNDPAVEGLCFEGRKVPNTILGEAVQLFGCPSPLGAM